MKNYRNKTIQILLLAFICFLGSPIIIEFIENIKEVNRKDFQICFDTTRYYMVDSYYPFYMSDYDRKMLPLTLKNRAEGLNDKIDEAEVTIKETDNGRFKVGIRLVYESDTGIPSVEEENAIFEAIVSRGWIEGFVDYGKTTEKKLFDNFDIELAESTVTICPSETGKEEFSVDFSLGKDIDSLLLKKERAENISMLYDGKVISEVPVSEAFQADRPNCLYFELKSEEEVNRVRTSAKTYPLKFKLIEVE